MNILNICSDDELVSEGDADSMEGRNLLFSMVSNHITASSSLTPLLHLFLCFLKSKKKRKNFKMEFSFSFFHSLFFLFLALGCGNKFPFILCGFSWCTVGVLSFLVYLAMFIYIRYSSQL